MVSFYGFITPLATPTLILSFCILYWVDKYNLFRRFSVPIDFSFELTNKIVTAFEISMFLFAGSHFVWDLSIHYDSSKKYRILSFVSPILALIYILLNLFTNDYSAWKQFFMSTNRPDPYSFTHHINTFDKGIFPKSY